jgi:hypothetical protein
MDWWNFVFIFCNALLKYEPQSWLFHSLCFPYLKVRICLSISPNHTHQGWNIKCKFLKEWYVEVNACLHACFQLQQTRLEHNEHFQHSNVRQADCHNITKNQLCSHMIHYCCFASPIYVLKLQNWILFVWMMDHTGVKNCFIMYYDYYVSWCSISYLKFIKYYLL